MRGILNLLAAALIEDPALVLPQLFLRTSAHVLGDRVSSGANAWQEAMPPARFAGLSAPLANRASATQLTGGYPTNFAAKLADPGGDDTVRP